MEKGRPFWTRNPLYWYTLGIITGATWAVMAMILYLRVNC